MEYFAGIVAIALFYVMISMAENVNLGWCGQFSIAQGGIVGIGAYTYAIGMSHDYPMALVLILCMVLGAAVGAALSLMGAGIGGDFFTIATLAFQVVLVELAQNMTSITGGFEGLYGIPPVEFFGYTPRFYTDWLKLLVPLTALYALVYFSLTATRFGVLLKAAREDETAAVAAGRRPLLMKVAALASASAGTALAGAILASFIGFIEPVQFGFIFSLLIFSTLLIGGLGNPLAPFAGAAVVAAMPELLRHVPNLPQDVRARLLQIIYALLLLLFVTLRPEGLIPERAGKWSFGRWTWQRTARTRPVGKRLLPERLEMPGASEPDELQ